MQRRDRAQLDEVMTWTQLRNGVSHLTDMPDRYQLVIVDHGLFFDRYVYIADSPLPRQPLVSHVAATLRDARRWEEQWVRLIVDIRLE